MKAEIIRLLKSCDGYLSGQELCEKLNVSRTAVWKVINQLREEGYEIEAVRNKGYRLVESRCDDGRGAGKLHGRSAAGTSSEIL